MSTNDGNFDFENIKSLEKEVNFSSSLNCENLLGGHKRASASHTQGGDTKEPGVSITEKQKKQRTAYFFGLYTPAFLRVSAAMATVEFT